MSRIILSAVSKFNRGLQMRNYCQHNLKKKIDGLEMDLTFRQRDQLDLWYGNKINPKYLISDFENRTEFLTVFPDMRKEIMEDPQFTEIDEIHYLLTDLFDYALSSRLNRGTLVWVGFKEMEELFPEKKFTDKDRDLCKLVGWSLELLETYTVIMDDYLDLSTDRRGMYCWYRFKGHGILSTYHAWIFKLMCQWVLDRKLKGHPAYTYCTEMQHYINYQVHTGQVATFMTDNASKFNLWLYNKIVSHKTESFMYMQSLSLAYYSASVFDKDLLAELESVTRVLGMIFQIQNDIYDCYGDKGSSGKVANDIQQGTCTWQISVAMGIASKAQKKILVDNYGKEDAECEQRVRDIFTDLDIRGIYQKNKQDSYNNAMKMIENGSDKLPKKALKLCCKHATVPYLDHTFIDTEFDFDDDWDRS